MQSALPRAEVTSVTPISYKGNPRIFCIGKMQDNTRAKRVQNRLTRMVFTLNNYTDEEYKWLTEVFPHRSTNPPKWIIVGKETCPDTGTLHLQGACILSTQTAFSTIKTWLGFRRAHLEPMRGKPEQSKTYCSKEDCEAFEFGILPAPGKRTDIHLAVEAIESGSSLAELAQTNGVAVVKFHKGLTQLRSLLTGSRDPNSPPTVYWLYGKTGTGKTKRAWEYGSAYGGPSCIWLSAGGMRWFDGYDGQAVAIFDDFRSKDCNFHFLLRVTDRYPLRVEFKGGYVEWKPDVIIFTTPDDIDTTFATRLEHRPEDIDQFKRRVTRVFKLPEDDEEFAELVGERAALSRVQRDTVADSDDR